ncbi:hypothetical protein [Streptomyces sp. NPDC058441]|uniref:hypothetical protein n=1 Tax=Streptomyces sp. NPDC058441 TaxID=3346502 RepID=UPI003648B8BA
MRYALNATGTLVPANEPGPGPFSCLRCERASFVRLSPHQSPHFVHTRGAVCELRRDTSWPEYMAMIQTIERLYRENNHE